MVTKPMTDEVSHHSLRHIVPSRPAFMSQPAFERWRRSFDMLLAMLRDGAADNGEAPEERFASPWLEHRALTACGPAGRTLAECAALNHRKLPAEVRAAARSLPETSWQLYDVVEDADPGVVLRRIHDDATFVCHGFENGAGVFAGETYALRLVDAGRFIASTLPIHIPASRATSLAARLEQEYASRSSTWSWEEYLLQRGSELIIDTLTDAAPASGDACAWEVDPVTSPSATDVPRREWERLARWYFRVAELRSSSRLLRVELPSGRIADVYGGVLHPVFELREDDRGFARVWSAEPHVAFAEDAAWSGDGDRVVLAARQDPDRVWHDVTCADVERLISALRWVAVHSAMAEPKAA